MDRSQKFCLIQFSAILALGLISKSAFASRLNRCEELLSDPKLSWVKSSVGSRFKVVDLKTTENFVVLYSNNGKVRVHALADGAEVGSLDLHRNLQVFGDVVEQGRSLTSHQADVPLGLAVMGVGADESGVPILRVLPSLKPSSLALEAREILPTDRRLPAQFSPDGSILYARYSSSTSLNSQSFGVFWDTRTGVQFLRVPDAGFSPKYSEDCQRIAVSIGKDRTRVFNRNGVLQDEVQGYPLQFDGDRILTQF